MSTDFKEETHQETKEPLSEEEIIKTLIDEFNSMFTREGMETNPYLIFKMNSSLEIPITAIYKDKRVSAICTNLAIIREALSKATSLTYNREKEIILPKFKPLRNKIVLNKIPDSEKDKIFRVVYQSPEYIHKVSDKYIENLKSYTLILRTEQNADSLVEKIKAVINKESLLQITLEYEDLYLDLLQKAQDIMKFQNSHPEEQGNFPYDAYFQNYGYFYGLNPYAGNYMGMMGQQPYGGPSFRGAANYNNQFYNNNYYNQMFIRKAQDETTEEPPRGDYHGRYGKKKDKYSKKPYFPKSQRGTQSDSKQHISNEEIKKRTRINSENFPPLVSEGHTQVENKVEEQAKVQELEQAKKNRQRYDKDDIIRLFKQAGSSVKPNEKLLKFNENTMPILNLAAKPNLEFIQASPIKKHPETITRKGKEEEKS